MTSKKFQPLADSLWPSWPPASPHSAPSPSPRLRRCTPAVSVYNVHMSEGNVGNKLMPFSVKLSVGSPRPAVGAAAAGSRRPHPGKAGTDFNGAGPYLVNFAANETAKVVNVPIYGDTLDEYDETFALKVVAHGPGITVADGEGIGQITDDDAQPTVAINDVANSEGTGGITAFTFTAKLSAVSGKTIKVAAVGQSGTAHIPDDLTAGPATLTFNPGVTSANYKASVNGDAKPEDNESFTVQLSNPSNVTITDAVGLGKVVNDDAWPNNPEPKPEPQPQPQPDPGNGGGNGGGMSGGGTVVVSGGGFDSSSPDAPAGDSDTASGAVAGEGEQALAPNAAADARPTHESIDGMTALLLILLGACALGLIAVTFVMARNRRDSRNEA